MYTLLLSSCSSLPSMLLWLSVEALLSFMIVWVFRYMFNIFGLRSYLLLQCSSDYAYGAGGFPAWGIQPNSVLDFEIEVLSVQ